MRHDRKQELIDCCNFIIRNADEITKNLGYNSRTEVKIIFEVGEVPIVRVERDFMPKEVVEK